MCDDDIHQDQPLDARMARRAQLTSISGGGASGGGSGVLTAAQAAVVEKDVDIATPDGVADAALFYPAGAGSWPAVLVWTDIMGLRPVYREMARRLAAQGHVVLVPNPFYRSGRAPVFRPDFNFGNPDDRAQAMAMRQLIGDEANMQEARAYLGFLDSLPQTDKSRKAGVQGYCMGGPMAFRTAAALPDRIGAVATFHGSNLVAKEPAAPASPHHLIHKMNAQVLIAVADNDHAAYPEAQDILRETFAAAGVPAHVEVYDGCPHGWCVPRSASYHEAGAERAWSELSQLYERALA